MRRSRKRLSLPAAILVAGCLAAGCGSTVKSAINSLPSKTATITATAGVTRTATTGVTSTATVTATATATAPATATVTATAAPSTPSVTTPAPTTSSAVSATGSGSGTDLLWLWVLLGVLVLAGLVALIARSARRRSAVAAGWRSRLIDAYAKGSALHDAMSVAEAPGELAAGDAAARWSDIQRRADDLAQTLYALREAVPQDSADRARIDDTLASLQAVRSAMDAERAPGGASLEQAEVVRSRLASFESSLRALGTPDR